MFTEFILFCWCLNVFSSVRRLIFVPNAVFIGVVSVNIEDDLVS